MEDHQPALGREGAVDRADHVPRVEPTGVLCRQALGLLAAIHRPDAGDAAPVAADVGADNPAPVVPDVSVSVEKGLLVTAPFVADDADGDPLTFAVVSGPSHGSVTIDHDWQRTTYPADPSKDVETVIRTAMDAVLSLPFGELTWDWELQTTALASSGEEKRVESWGLEWAGEVPDAAGLTCTASWQRNRTWDDPEKDSTQVRLEVELGW